MKRILIGLLLFVLCSCFVWALPSRKTGSDVEALPSEVVPDATSQKVSSETVTDTSNGLTTLLTSLDNKVLVSGNVLKELKEEFAVFKEDYDLLVADNRSLHEEKKGVRYFANVGAAFGFGENLRWGATADFGIRINHLVIKTGAQYLFGNLRDIKAYDWRVDNLSASVTVGWEW